MERELLTSPTSESPVAPTYVAQQPGGVQRGNVGTVERWLSSIGGGALTAYGLRQRTPLGWALALLGGGLVWRGVSGQCPVYQSLGLSTAQRWQGFSVEQSVTINASAEELYRFWHNFENLPRFMRHLEAVQVLDDRRSHWVAKAPAGTTVEWDAEIISDQPNELIAWRSLPGADVDNAGSVRFVAAPGGRGVEVHVTLGYNPPAGAVGKAVAKLFGEEPKQQVGEDLRRFKQLIETGEVATNEGQPSGERSLLGKILSPNS